MLLLSSSPEIAQGKFSQKGWETFHNDQPPALNVIEARMYFELENLCYTFSTLNLVVRNYVCHPLLRHWKLPLLSSRLVVQETRRGIDQSGRTRRGDQTPSKA